MANNKVLQAIVEIAGSVSPTLQKAVEDTASKLDKVNLKAVAVGAACAAGAVAVGKAAVEAGKYLVDLGAQFDEAQDAIRVGTGATGDALEALMDDFDAVYSSVPTTMEDAGKAIADYNTRLGLTGDALQGVSTQAIQVADMLDEDLGTVIETSSKAFQQWNIDADNMGGAMDYVFKAAQSTGVGFSELMQGVQQYGAQLQEMGYNFEEATALIGQMEKAGVNTTEVLAAMKKSVSSLAKEGLSASEGMELYTEAIKNAKDMTQATNIAAEIFGTRGASTMAAAIRDGTIDVAALTAELEKNSETISGCAADTYDFAEQLQLFKQKAQVALEPLAATMFNSLNELMPIVGDLMESLIPIIQDMTKTLTPLITDLVAKIGPMLQELVPPLVNIASSLLQKLIPPLVEIISSVIPVLIQLVQMLAPIVEFIVGEILPAVVDILNELLPVAMEIISKVLPVATQLLQRILPLLTQVIDTILPVVIDLIETLIPPLMEIIDAIIPVVIQLLEILLPIVNEIIGKVLPVVNKLLGAILPLLAKLISSIMPVVIELLNLLSPILDLIMALLSPILDLVVAILNPILDLITSALEPLISVLTGLIQFALEPLKPLIEIVASLFEGVLGDAINAIMPIVEALQKTFGGLIQFITSVFSGDWSGAWEGICNIFAGYWDYLKAIVKAPIEFIKNVVGKLGKAIGDVFKVAWDRIAKIWGKVGKFFSGIWEGVTKVFSKAWDGIKQVFAPVADFFSGVWDKISGAFSVAVDWFRNIFKSVGDAIHTVVDPWIEIFRRVWDMIKEAFAPVVEFFSGIFTSAWEGIKTAFSTVGEFFLGIWNSIKSVFATVGSWFSSVFSGAWDGIKQAFSAASSFFSGVWSGIKGAFSAVTDWFRGVFSSAWQAVKDVFSTGGKIFEGMKDGILSAFKAVVNAIIKGINKVVSVPFDGINAVLKKLKGIEIVGIKPFSWINTFSVPQIPLLAAGGFTDGVSIAGEAGTEAVISFDPAYRDANIRTWTMAGKLLGVLDNIEMTDGAKAATAASIQMIELDRSRDETPQLTQAGRLMELDDFSLGQLTETTIIYYDFSGFTWSPQIEAGTGTDKQEIMDALKEHESEFFDWLEEWLRQKEVGKYDRVSIY